MRSIRLLSISAALFAAILLSGDTASTTALAKSGPKLTKDTDVCVYSAHGSKAEKVLHAKPSNPGGGKGGGGGGGGGGGDDDGSSCSKTYSYWSGSTIAVWVDSGGGPSAVDATTFEAYVDHALDEWSCHSGLGESTTFVAASSASAADITVGWGDLGTTGILGQANTSYYRRGAIVHSDVEMNSNQAGFSWTAGPTPAIDSSGCAVEATNGTAGSYDFLSVLTHEVGHALGISHPNKRCKASDACYAETMFSCTGPAEFMRRALNGGDKFSISSLYGLNQ